MRRCWRGDITKLPKSVHAAPEWQFAAMCYCPTSDLIGRPDLPQKIIGALARDKVAGKSAALCDHLCPAATCEAFRAEDDLAVYRVKRPEELHIAIRTTDFGQVVEDTHEIPWAVLDMIPARHAERT
ncbi:MAG: hypothetical protein ABI407_18805 [Bradyrhizobium sp.]